MSCHDTTLPTSLTLPANLESIATARTFAREALPELPQALRDDVILAVSELATNAVKHAARDSKFRVDLERKDKRVCVAVTDGGGGGSTPGVTVSGLESQGGRGLWLLANLGRLEYRRDGAGWRVAVTLPRAEVRQDEGKRTGRAGGSF